jgi:ketosteroid isomerase-like protein
MAKMIKMERTFKFSWLLVIVFASAFINPVQSQDVKKELADNAKKFEENYNKKDDKALKMMYTENAVRTEPDGSIITGNENIRIKLAEAWSINKLNLTIKQDKVETQADGTVIASGTYQVTGTTDAGDPFAVGGAYTNTMVKDNGSWKISKSMLSNL